MNRTEKAELIETLQSTLSEATSVVVTHQIGLTVAESSELRARMREAGAGFKVTKNRLTKIALQSTKYEEMTEMFSGPTAMGTSADPVSAAKTLVAFAKENDKLTIVGGALDGKDIDGSSNGGAPSDSKEQKRKTPIAFIPPKPEDDKQLQDAIQLLIGLRETASAKNAPNS